MDAINVMDIASTSSESKKNRSTSDKFLKKLFDSAGDSSSDEHCRRVSFLLRLCGIDTDHKENIHQKLFCSRFAFLYLLCFTYLFTLRIVSLWIYRKNGVIIHMSAVLVSMICFGVWLSVQIQSNKIVTLVNDLIEMIQKDDFPSRINLSSKLMFLSLTLAISGAGTDIITQVKDAGYRKYYYFGFEIHSSSLSIFLIGLGLTTTLYCTFVIPTVILFVYNFLSEVICSMLDSFRIRTMNSAAAQIENVRPRPIWKCLRTDSQTKIVGPKLNTKMPTTHLRTPGHSRMGPCVKTAPSVNDVSMYIDIDTVFYQHKWKLKLVQQLKDSFSVILFILFTKHFFNLFLTLSLLIYFPNAFGNPDREATVTFHMLYGTFSLVGTIILSSRVPSSQQDIINTYRNIYEDRMYFKRVVNDCDSQLLKAMVDREVIHMSAGNMFDISNRHILIFFGVFVSYAALIITDVLQPDKTACVSVVNSTSSDSV